MTPQPVLPLGQLITLPDEIILESLPGIRDVQRLIFRRLDFRSLINCMTVSKAFKSLAENTEVSYKGLMAKLLDHKINANLRVYWKTQPLMVTVAIEQSIEKWPTATSLELKEVQYPSGPNLYEGSTNFDEDDCLYLLGEQKSFRRISIESVNLTNRIVEAALNLEHISILELSGNNNINGECAPSFEKARDKLISLSLIMQYSDDFDDPTFEPDEVVRILNSQTRLKNLCLRVCDIITPEIIQAIIALPSIETVNLHGEITPEDAVRLAKGCLKLTHLSLSGIRNLGAIETALASCKDKITISLI